LPDLGNGFFRTVRSGLAAGGSECLHRPHPSAAGIWFKRHSPDCRASEGDFPSRWDTLQRNSVGAWLCQKPNRRIGWLKGL